MNKLTELYIQEGYQTTYSYVNDCVQIYSERIDGLALRVIEKKHKKLISTKLSDYKNIHKFRDHLLAHDKNIHLKNDTVDRLKVPIILEFENYIFNEILKILGNNLSLVNIKMQRISVKKNISLLSKEIKKCSNLLFVCVSEKKTRYNYCNIVDENNYKDIIEEIFEFSKYLGFKRTSVVKDGVYNIIVSNSAASLLFHEACGHSFELSKYNYKYSPLNLKEYRKIGCYDLTIKDTPFKITDSENFDDEGSVKTETTLIKNGRVFSLLTDINSSLAQNSFNITGNCRRESHHHYPESRMYCTFVENGNSSLSDTLKNVENGIYIDSISEAYLNHKSGKVRCFVDRAYAITGGKINKEIIRCEIDEYAVNILGSVFGICDDLIIKSGFCMSNSGNLYVEYGSPTVFLRNINLCEVFKYEKQK